MYQIVIKNNLGGIMKFNYIRYFKYMILLQLRRKCSSIEKFLKKFFPHISYKKLFIIVLLKYAIEVCSVSSVVYLMVKNNKEITKQIIFPFMIIYLIIYTIRCFVNNYNRIIEPENEEFMKIFPIRELKRNIIIYTNAFIFGIFESFLKRILQIYIPFMFIFERVSIVGTLFGIIFVLIVSIFIAIIIISLKFIVTKGRVTIIKTGIYIGISAIVYKLTSIVVYHAIKILNTFPYNSLKTKNVEQINNWIGYIYDVSNKYINYFVGEYLIGENCFILFIKDIVQGKSLIYNVIILLGYIIIVASVALLLVYLCKSEKDEFAKKEDIIVFFFSIPIYIVFLLIYIAFFNLNIYEFIVLFFNLIFIYYFGTSFHLIGSLFITNFNWNHIDDQGNNIGQRYISSTSIVFFQFLYAMILALEVILFLVNAWKILFIANIIVVLSFYKVKTIVQKKALIKLNKDIYSEAI